MSNCILNYIAFFYNASLHIRFRFQIYENFIQY